MEDPETKFIISTFYKFTSLEDCSNLKLQLTRFCRNNGILGTILLANEGINATITGSRKAIDHFYEFIKAFEELQGTIFKESTSSTSPFKKLKIKIRSEIVTFKIQDLDMNKVGKHLKAKEWNELIKRDDAIVVDCRNDYEVVFGTFQNAVDPKTRNFTDLIDWIDRNIPKENKQIPIAMFCTGGVRCEKSTAYMLKLGYENVYHLEGGILQYLEDTKNQEENLWMGQCFVFDDRIAVDKKLNPYKG